MIAGVLMIARRHRRRHRDREPEAPGRGRRHPRRRARPASAATRPTATAAKPRRSQPATRQPEPATRIGLRVRGAHPIIFSGIQPTGRKHLGNYIGAIRQYVEGQERGEPAIFCIVDLHAISVAYDPVELRERVYDTTAILLAAGLDPERCILFRQSDVREHTELTWLLSAVTAHGDLNRMTPVQGKVGASSASWSRRRSSSTRC